jgi:RIO kinase 1
MFSERFLDDKNLKKIDKKFQQIIKRRGINNKTQDEVFDKYTLSTIEKLISDKIINIIDHPISTGKEGNVFRAMTPKKKFVALKIFRTSTSTFKHISDYIVGDPRFENIHKNRKDIIHIWTKKEFKNLEKLKKIGVKAPKPIVFIDNILVMQYIGNSKHAAPMLKDVKVENPQDLFNTIIDYIFLMFKKGEIVHSDLSAFNILYYRKKPYIIDLGQGVLLEHPRSLEFLKRDIDNIVRYFKKYNIKADINKIYNKIVN